MATVTNTAARTLRLRFMVVRDWLGRFPLSILQLGMRVGVGFVFFNAGILKFQSFEFAVKLFQDEYKVPLLPPEVAARITMFNELTWPSFLFLGLASRFATLPLLGQLIVAIMPSQKPSPGVGTIAADASGVYVGLDVGVLAKFDSHGNASWTRTTGAYDLFGPASDGAGVYVSGRIYNQPNPIVYFLRRYDADGDQLWSLQTDVWFNPVADASGVYVAGTMAGQTTDTLFVRKYDPSGAELWTRTFLTLKSGPVDNGISVAVGASGLYALGGDDSSTTMAKYDLVSGNLLWSRQLPRLIGPPMAVDDTF